MLTVMACTKIMWKRKIHRNDYRFISKYLDKDIMSKAVRQRFLDYFINGNSHNFIRSSPVIPYCDGSVAFVNAGMNQFKGIFLGNRSPTYRKVANSQKCVRVGGKHNDLSIVGTDGSHNTFFEMLGNWSFGDYFKKEACELAWKLLTDVYKINKGTLYVTYFNGDEKLRLEPDLECKEIWRSIGVAEDRILPFGMKDNFWEMGSMGPCGPCTEIHVDQRGFRNRGAFVNKGLHDLTEVWNIVFIQYNRNKFGAIEPLPQYHIDTGMGLERLCALLQGRLSNFDTDLFRPLFLAIERICKDVPKYNGNFGEKDWNGLQTNYRILADHTRMLTACLADGMIPEENQKLRRIMRRAFLIGQTTFNNDSGLVKELANYVVESLGSVYVEMEKNINQVRKIIDYEEDLYKTLRSTSAVEWVNIVKEEPALSNLEILEMPGLVSAYKDIKNNGIKEISPNFGIKLYDTYGIDKETIIKLAEALSLPFNKELFKKTLQNSKKHCKGIWNNETESLSTFLGGLVLTNTKDHYKYKYYKKGKQYKFHSIEATIIKLIQGDEFINEVEPNTECRVIFDKTSFYHESGGQACDKGYAVNNNGIFEINDVENINKLLLHKGTFKSNKKLSVGEKLIIKIDETKRVNSMRNHTATHLLNAVLKKLKGITCQKSSKVNDKYLNLDSGIFSDKVNMPDIHYLENEVNKIIREGVEVKTSEIDSQELLMSDNITLIPGEIYPDTGIKIIEIKGKNFLSREPCCGTHVFNTSDIEEFCITSVKSLGRSTVSIYAVTGPAAKQARTNGADVSENILNLQRRLDDNIDKPEVFDMTVSSIRNSLNYKPDDDYVLPVTVKHECLEKLNEINKQIKSATRNTLKEFIEMEMKSVLETKVSKTRQNKEYIVHYLRSSMILESVPLQKATKMCPNIPIIVISYADNMVKARCCVPQSMCTKDFNAQKWLSQVSVIFKSTAAAPKGQDPNLVSNMKAKYISIQEWDTLLSESLNLAKSFAENYL